MFGDFFEFFVKFALIILLVAVVLYGYRWLALTLSSFKRRLRIKVSAHQRRAQQQMRHPGMRLRPR
jgi:hypothetical protein